MNNPLKKKYCIYCGKNEANEGDHVPPKSFFPKPLPSDLITVPSCSDCNREFGKIDEFIRNVFISLDTTESIPNLDSIREKLHRSMKREKSFKLLVKIYSTIKQVEIIDESGIKLIDKPAFDLDRIEYDKFFERISRALLYVENGVKYFHGSFKWKKYYKDQDLKSMLSKLNSPEIIEVKNASGNGMFKYQGVFWKNKPTSIWFVNFYDGIEFMIYVSGKDFSLDNSISK